MKIETKLKPYPEYKTTGQGWLGEVPTHWEVLPNRALFREIKDQNHPDEPLLSVTISRGVIPQEVLLADSSQKDSSNLDRSKYKLVRPGDIAYNKMRAWQGALGVSEHRGIVSPAYIVVRPRQAIDPRFYHYLLRTPAFVTAAERRSYGITSDMWSLRYEDFKQIYCVLPPIGEQRRIARHLDQQNKRVNRLIRAKQRLIALLNEQKQAIIQRAVTRGLNPDVPMKPSGVDWLGEVPEHWERISLRYLSTHFGSGLTPRGGASVYTSSGVPFLRSQNIHFDGIRLDGIANIPEHIHQSMSNSHVHPRDVLINITGASIGRVCGVPKDFGPANVNQHVCIVRPKPELVLSEYLAAYLSSPSVQHEIRVSQEGASREGLTLQALKSILVLVPTIHEQAEIAASIAERSRELQEAIAATNAEIALIREYRARLIADVVTGKLDVRGVEVPSVEDVEEAGVASDALSEVVKTKDAVV